MDTPTRQDEDESVPDPNCKVRPGGVSKGPEGAGSERDSTSNVGTRPGARQGPKPCSCGFCDGVTVEVENVNLHTGETETDSFEKMSRRKKCPNCGGVNVEFRRSYVAHAADVVGRVAGKRNVYALHVTLDADAVARAGIAPEDTYKVWTDGGPWSRARRNIRKRDDDLVFIGSLSARPSDGMYHLHLVLVTRLSVQSLTERLHAAGLDSYVQSFARSEDADSKEQFAAMWAAYAFDNAAHGASSRLTSGGEGGVGYDSTGAKERRREAVAGPDGDEHAPARGPRRNQPHERAPDDAPDGPTTGPDDGVSAPQNGDRAPPVVMDGGTYRDREGYMGAVRREFSRRVGTAVHVHGMGAADLLKVVGGTDGLTCTVAPKIGTEAVEVSWTEIHVRNAPVLRRPRRPDRGAETDTSAPTDHGEHDGPGPAARYNEAARTSRVTVELADGRRHVTEKDHRTGQALEYMLPPRRQ